MATFSPPQHVNGIPLSDRSRYLLFAPMWMLFPGQRRKELTSLKSILSEKVAMLNDVKAEMTATAWIAKRAKPRSIWLRHS